MGRVSMVVDRDVEAQMRDGTILRADVYRPAVAGPVPTLLTRTPYDRSQPMAVGAAPDPLSATARGYAVVIQDVRGRFGSDGAFVPFVNEANDGYDTVEWLAAQPWCDGNVGMYGASYVGYTQWMAASQQPPHLRAIAPVVATSDLHDYWVYEGGAQSLWFDVSWLMVSLGPNLLDKQLPGDDDQGRPARRGHRPHGRPRARIAGRRAAGVRRRSVRGHLPDVAGPPRARRATGRRSRPARRTRASGCPCSTARAGSTCSSAARWPTTRA